MPRAKGRRGAAKKAEKKPVKKDVKNEEDEDEVENVNEESEIETTQNGGTANEESGVDVASDDDEEEEPKAKRGRPSTTKKASKTPKKKAAAPKGKKKSAGRPAKKPMTKKNNESEDESDEDDEKEYEVEKILEVRYPKNKPKEFQVKWKGYPRAQATWEPETNLQCPELMEAFMKQVETRKDATDHELRTQRKQTDRYQDARRSGGVRSSKRFSARPRTTYHGQED